LLCFNGSIFDIKILKLFTPPQQLIEYYTNFNTFYSQSIVAGGADGLNARDKWSKLITSYANENINFKRNCEYGSLYEVASGKAKDKSKSNFLQLIINLLGVSNWADFSKSEIIKIQDNTNHDGFGTLYITHYKLGKFEISCNVGHYSMKSLSEEKGFDIDYHAMNDHQKDIIDKLLGRDIDNLMWIKIDSDFINQVLYPRANFTLEIKVNIFLLFLKIWDCPRASVQRLRLFRSRL
jgi:hypothetical protein